LGTGTLSGAAHAQSGSMLALSEGGKQPISLPNGERRTFIFDGDTVIFTAACQRDGGPLRRMSNYAGLMSMIL
jgi:fumarylacetoacetase